MKYKALLLTLIILFAIPVEAKKRKRHRRCPRVQVVTPASTSQRFVIPARSVVDDGSRGSSTAEIPLHLQPYFSSPVLPRPCQVKKSTTDPAEAIRLQIPLVREGERGRTQPANVNPCP